MSQETIDNHLLWKVTKGKKSEPSYLYGTVHSRQSEVFIYVDELTPIIQSCERFAGEIDMSLVKESSALDDVFMEDMTLADLYTEEEMEFVRSELLDKLGVGAMMAFSMQPMFISGMIMEMNAKADSAVVLDQYLQELAISSGLTITGLESSEEAMNSIGSVDLEEQADLLYEFLEEYDEQMETLNDLTEWYVQESLDSMYITYTESGSMESFDESLVVERNKKFTKNLVKLMRKQTVFCAIGALHLPGETGMIEALRRKGYTVTSIPLRED